MKPEAGLPPLPIVENFNVFRYITCCFHPRPVTAVMDQFGFQATKEIFHWGIVVTVALSAHGGNHAQLCQQFLITFEAVLAAPI